MHSLTSGSFIASIRVFKVFTLFKRLGNGLEYIGMRLLTLTISQCSSMAYPVLDGRHHTLASLNPPRTRKVTLCHRPGCPPLSFDTLSERSKTSSGVKDELAYKIFARYELSMICFLSGRDLRPWSLPT